MSELRPLALGEIIDRSASFWRGNVRPLFALFLGFQLVQFILLKIWEVTLTKVAPAALGGAQAIELAKSDPDKAFLQMGVGGTSIFAVMILTFFISQVSGVAATRFIYPRVLGQPGPTAGEGLKDALARFGTTLGAFTLAIAWSLVVGFLFLLPAAVLTGLAAVTAESSRAAAVGLGLFGALALFAGSLLTMLWFIIRFILMSQVIALEDAGAVQVFRRTGQLSSGRIGPGVLGLVKVRLTLLVTVVGVIVLLVSFVSGVPQFLLQVVYGNVLDPMRSDPGAIPQALMVPAQLLQVVVGSLVGPLYVVLQVMFYVDMRVRREGLDLKLKLATPARPVDGPAAPQRGAAS